jgi:hypothetical protein
MMDKYTVLEHEAKGCFDFFWNETTTEGPGYGLIRDNTHKWAKDVSSIASVGFGLSAYVIGVQRGWITKEQGYERALGTLKTLYQSVEHMNGFFFHFIYMNSGKRAWNSEITIIDTAILLMGALTASEYYGGEVMDYFEKIYRRVNWEWYRDKKGNMFYMGYHIGKGFSGWWDLYAEQIMMYILGAASPTYPVDKEMYYTFGRNIGKYKGNEFIYTYTGSLFAYQFTHAWVDFRNKKDRLGADWFNNSVKAVMANRQCCIDNSHKFKTYGENSWGMTACETPHGYDGSIGGAPSANNNTTHLMEGTIPPCGAVGSIVFAPEESIDAMNHMYYNLPQLWCQYGFKDAYNLDNSPVWFSECVIGIDKGISLLMLENYRSGLMWDLTMNNEYIKKGMELLEIRDINEGASPNIVVA